MDLKENKEIEEVHQESIVPIEGLVGKYFWKKDFSVVLSKEYGKWHLSIARRDRLPSYDELKEARYTFLPDKLYMAQIFPPQNEFVNKHPFCLHLYEI